MQRTARGFTLIELMIVIAIIAILAAILIPNYLHARAESQTVACEDYEKQIATALEEYAVDNGSYPATGVVTPALFGVGTSYLAVTPLDPVSGAQYQLHGSGAGLHGSRQQIRDHRRRGSRSDGPDTASGARSHDDLLLLERGPGR